MATPTTQLTCGEFEYAGDATTLGDRYAAWVERFDLYLTATGITDAAKSKASFLLLLGKEAYDIYLSKKNVGKRIL
jgi:hypothetical protein